MSLVVLDPEVCPTCGAAIEGMTIYEPALVRHGGYGATRRTLLRFCLACGYLLKSLVTEDRP